jgi:dolichyl-phosphate beta-glucosyltransferase
MNNALDISVIIPAKNEEERLPRFLTTIAEYCRRSALTYEIIVVDDGSTDATAANAESFRSQLNHLKVISLKQNRGKGFAVRRGFFAAQGNIVVFLDADGSTPIEEVERNLHYFKEGFDIVIGSRVVEAPDRHVNALAYRKMIGIVFNFLVHLFLMKDIKDTQCGFKMFRHPIVRPLFGRVNLNGFGFDLEVLYIAHLLGYTVKEVAVDWTHVDGSKISIVRDSFDMFVNILQIKNWHYIPINRLAQHMSAKEMANMYSQEKRHWWFIAKGEFIKRIIAGSGIRPSRTLDAGCGTGHNLKFLSTDGSYVGSDVSLDGLRFCKQNGVRHLVQSNLEQMSFKKKSFDLIISLDVIEHCEDAFAAVRQLNRLLSDDGRLLITVPAFQFLWGQHDESLSHMRRYTKKDLEILLTEEGLRIERMGFLYSLTFLPAVVVRVIHKIFFKEENPRCDTFTTPPPLINRTLAFLLRLESRLVPHFPLPFGTSLYAVAVKSK